MPYEIYVNHIRNKAIIHDATCNTLRQHGGVSVNPGTQEYSGVIESWEEADQRARSYNKSETRTHKVCLPNINL